MNPGNRRQIGWVGMVGKGGAVHTSLQSDISTYTRTTSAHKRRTRQDFRLIGKGPKLSKVFPLRSEVARGKEGREPVPNLGTSILFYRIWEQKLLRKCHNITSKPRLRTKCRDQFMKEMKLIKVPNELIKRSLKI